MEQHEFSCALRKLMDEKGLTQEDVARRCGGKEQSTIFRWLSGDGPRKADRVTMLKLAAGQDVSEDFTTPRPPPHAVKLAGFLNQLEPKFYSWRENWLRMSEAQKANVISGLNNLLGERMAGPMVDWITQYSTAIKNAAGVTAKREAGQGVAGERKKRANG